MHKLIYLLIPITLGFFSCNRKATEYTPELIYELPCDTLDVSEIFEPIDTFISNGDITIDTGSTNLTYNGTILRLSTWEPKLDTSDVIIKYVFNWEEGEIETLTGKIVYTSTRFGSPWIDVMGKSPDSKFFKVKDGIWIPTEWPKDIVNVYIRPKK